MTRAEKKEELIGLFSTGAIFIGDLIDECFEFGQQHPHWISVEDELPNDYEPVIAAFDRHFVRVCFHCGDTWYLDNPPVAEPMSGITHWMRLSQAPVLSNSENTGKDLKGGEK